jgi:tRNA threonylcarbamoyl adenosine modification protein (Sua5/YciO/YrdC/YwlC family)
MLLLYSPVFSRPSGGPPRRAPEQLHTSHGHYSVGSNHTRKVVASRLFQGLAHAADLTDNQRLRLTREIFAGRVRSMIVSLNPQNPQKRQITRVCEVLQKGGIIAYPTDTFYGIGCDLMNKKGIQLIYKLKNRPLKQPFSFVCDGLKEISLYAQVSNYAYKTMKRCLPGPYTFILEATQLVPKIMMTKRRTVGIRVPDNKICLTIVRSFGRPIISTSAGFDDPQAIEETYAPHLDLVVDGGVLYPEPSSVISLIDDVPEVIREGKGDVSLFR